MSPHAGPAAHRLVLVHVLRHGPAVHVITACLRPQVLQVHPGRGRVEGRALGEGYSARHAIVVKGGDTWTAMERDIGFGREDLVFVVVVLWY